MGLILLALGTALTACGGFGISMVVAPAYLLYLKLSETLPFFSFGMAEYLLQAVILLALSLLMRKARPAYLFSFVSAVLYGFLLDGCMALTGLLPLDQFWLRLSVYVLGVLLCTAGIALLFRAYLPPAAYELFVKELSRKLRKPLTVVKTVYDCASLLVAAGMALVLFGQIRGIGVGTVLCAVIYGTLIRLFSDLYDKYYVFRDMLPLRTRFEESEEHL